MLWEAALLGKIEMTVAVSIPAACPIAALLEEELLAEGLAFGCGTLLGKAFSSGSHFLSFDGDASSLLTCPMQRGRSSKLCEVGICMAMSCLTNELRLRGTPTLFVCLI